MEWEELIRDREISGTEATHGDVTEVMEMCVPGWIPRLVLRLRDGGSAPSQQEHLCPLRCLQPALCAHGLA